MSSASAPLVDRALALLAALDVAAPDKRDAARIRLDRWRAADPEHAAAYEQALREWRALAGLSDGLRERFAQPAARQRKPAAGSIAAVLLVVAVACASGLAYWRLPVFEQVYRTGTAQLARADLPDGTRLDLSARTELAVSHHRDRRTARLERGEARFDVARDAARPFTIEARGARVEVLGTTFTVAERGGALIVAVEHGAVRVVPPGDEAVPRTLRAGERVVVREGRAGEVQPYAVQDAAAWRDGWLAFDNEPLGEALAAINAFAATPLVVADARTAALRLTGRFRATDTRALLAALPQVLPVETAARADGTVEIRAR